MNNDALIYTNAEVHINRTKFNSRSRSLVTSCNEGDLVPVFFEEILPGDTYSIDTGSFTRLQTMIAPVMGDCYEDVYFFFVPNRLVWDHWKEFCGENNTSAWTEPTEYTIPQITSPEGGWQKGTIAQAFGIPIGVSNLSVGVLPFRAYAMIYNEWFRSENVQDPTFFEINDNTIVGSNGSNILTDLVKGGKYAKVGKLRDVYVSSLPAPQRGPAVELPIGSTAPVLFGNDTSNYLGKDYVAFKDNPHWITAANGKWAEFPNGTNRVITTLSNNDATGQSLAFTTSASLSNASVSNIDNAYADLSSAAAVTVNQLRLAFQTQRLYEALARGGSRYQELIWQAFNVLCPDFRVQRSEYLGGSRHRLDMSSVVQTSESANTPQGTITGISATAHSNSDFTKSFTEHGMLIGLATIRVKHLYSQGIPRYFNKKNKFDFYYPQLAHIGEVGVLNEEIYAQGTSEDKEIFGYQEAWYDYRYAEDRVSGEFAPTYAQSLSHWTFADKYSSLPILGTDFMQEGTENIDRVVAVQSSVSDQFKLSLMFDVDCVRCMPLHSIPGLIDHF